MSGLHLKIKAISIAAVLLLVLSSCSLPNIFIRQHGYNEGAYDVTVVKDINKIEDMAFYIQKADGTFLKPYIGETTFVGEASPNRLRVAWFGKDFEKIPVMNKGDKIVFRSVYEFSPAFSVERFQDIGYTLGICGMSPTSAGRYQFSTDPRARSIDINSSAGTLYNLGDHTVTMEVIGDTPLRHGNISRAGTIMGLQRGKTYAAEVYIGTEIMKYKLIADVRALLSMESYTIRDFTYEQSKVISFSFPEYFNSGYYYIGRFGMVKYVNSDKEYSDTMAMNVPNPRNTKNDAVQQAVTATTETVPFTVDETCSIEVSVQFDLSLGNSTEGKEQAAGNSAIIPTGRVIGESGSYTLNPSEAGDCLVGTFTLEPGRYKIEIVGLAGRSYSYMVRKADPVNP